MRGYVHDSSRNPADPKSGGTAHRMCNLARGVVTSCSSHSHGFPRGTLKLQACALESLCYSMQFSSNVQSLWPLRGPLRTLLGRSRQTSAAWLRWIIHLSTHLGADLASPPAAYIASVALSAPYNESDSVMPRYWCQEGPCKPLSPRFSPLGVSGLSESLRGSQNAVQRR